MIATGATVDEWARYVDAGFMFADYPPGARVLDVGFGRGHEMTRLVARGCLAIGIEPDFRLAADASAHGFLVICAAAEHLPFASASFDGLICEVVIPYTDEAAALREIGRVLRPGGIARLSYHGAGYSLRHVTVPQDWRQWVYGVRVLINTWVYVLTGRALPGFFGDTLYQSRRRLNRHYRQSGLQLVEERPYGTYAGCPVFLFHCVRRVDGA